VELGRLPACRAEGLLNVVFPVILQQFGNARRARTCKAITSGESRAANSIPWRVMVLPAVDGNDPQSDAG